MIQMASDFDGSYDLVIEAYKGQLITVTSFSNSPKRAGEMDDLGIINGGMVLVKDGIITVVGDSEEVLREIEHRGGKIKPDKYIDFEAYPKVVLPGFVDTHTHLVFAGSRAHEYESKIKGEAYEAQHGNGKGILYTVNMTRQEHEAKLFYKGRKILEQMLEYGTTTMEIKSG